ncbi:MAG: HAMP domain-containing sensor histidine kinase, partial [Verrucomicrobiota bacterium]
QVFSFQAEESFEISATVVIFLADGRFFGTLCSIDPNPARLKTPEMMGMFKLFAELISFHIEAAEKLAASESRLLEERGASELREQFIGVLGHDLRNPLGAISMGTMLLKDSNLESGDVEVVEMMERSVARMSDLIDDVMDFTRGRLGGGIPLQDKALESLEPVLTQVIEELRTRWPERRIETRFALAGRIHFDRKRMAQLFSNLLSNALTHGKAETPVAVTAIHDAGGMELSVSNAADPIPPEVLARLFEPFSRGNGPDYQEGLGLGLYIASEIAKSHGGSLTVVSTEAETRFTFSMPAGAAEG